MTDKLYENSENNIKEFTAKITDIQNTSDQAIIIILDKTQFFPEAGGQSCDKGIITCLGHDFSVIKVEEIKGEILHYCIPAKTEDGNHIDDLKIGVSVRGYIDWHRRLSFMQHHSAEHLISGLVNDKLGYNNVGFHLSDSICTMDYDGPIEDSLLKEIEEKANQVIYENVSIKTYFPSEYDLKEIPYRSKKELEGPIRIVEIEGYDICACCAPHLKSTGQIGLIKIVNYESYKGGCRLTLLAGQKAYEYLCLLEKKMGEICTSLNSNIENIDKNIESLMATKETLRLKLIDANREILFNQLEKIPTKDNENLYFACKDIDNKVIRDGVNFLVDKYPNKYCLIIDDEKSSFIIGSKEKDCSTLAAELRKENIAKCGGSPEMIQGSTNNIEQFFKIYLTY